MSDEPPKMKNGKVVPPEWFDNEPSLIGDDELRDQYDDEFQAEMDELVNRHKKP